MCLCEGEGGLLLYAGNAGFKGRAVSSQEISVLLFHEMKGML